MLLTNCTDNDLFKSTGLCKKSVLKMSFFTIATGFLICSRYCPRYCPDLSTEEFYFPQILKQYYFVPM